MSISQPMTAKQISKVTRLRVDSCSHVLGKFKARGMVICLNPTARNSRVFGLTELGLKCRKQLARTSGKAEQDMVDVADIDWELYGWVCFRHRAAVIQILTEPMQPSAMKRRLRNRNSGIRISANNVRDIVKLFLARGIVQQVYVRKKAHPLYEQPFAIKVKRSFIPELKPPETNFNVIAVI